MYVSDTVNKLISELSSEKNIGKQVSQLASIGNQAILPLVQAVKENANPFTRRNAANALYFTAKTINSKFLDPEFQFRGTISLTFNMDKVIEKYKSDVIPVLLNALNDSDIGVRYYSAQTLACLKIKEKAIIQTFVDVIKRKLESYVNNDQYEKLEFISWNYLFGEMKNIGEIAEDVVPTLIKVFEKNNDYHIVTDDIFELIANIGEKAEPVLPALVEYLGNNLFNMELLSGDKILQAITNIGTKKVLDAYINAYKKGIHKGSIISQLLQLEHKIPDTFVKFVADDYANNIISKKIYIQVLGKTESSSDKVLQLKNMATTASNSETREQVINSLTQQGEIAIPTLIELMNDSSWKNRSLVIKALGDYKIVRDDIVSALIQALDDTDSATVRKEAATALGNLSIESAIEKLTSMSKQDQDYAVRYEALKAIALIKGEPIPPKPVREKMSKSVKTATGSDLDSLITYLDSANLSTKMVAINKLGALGVGAKKAIPKMIEIYKNDTNPTINAAIKRALRIIAIRMKYKTIEELIKAYDA